MSEGALLLIFVLLGAFFAGCESAFTKANRLKLELKARNDTLSAQTALKILNDPSAFFSTVYIGSSVAKLIIPVIVSYFFLHYYQWDFISILIISSLIIILFSELIPKYIAGQNPDSLALYTAIPLRFFSIILSPIVRIAGTISNRITGTTAIRSQKLMNIFEREDIEEIVEESEEAGTVNKSDSRIITKVLNLREQSVSEVMRPRTEVTGVEISASIDEVLSIFIESGFSKIPVFEDNLDNIKGVIHAPDLFNSPSSLQDIIRPVIFVPESRNSLEMLSDFIQERYSFAVVVDEFGGTAGIITREDIVEELFGEIKDEYDTEEDICRKINDTTFIISGKIEIDHINEQFGLSLPKEDYETIAGLIIAVSGKIPLQNETVQYDKYNFFIVRATNVRIELVKMTITK